MCMFKYEWVNKCVRESVCVRVRVYMYMHVMAICNEIVSCCFFSSCFQWDWFLPDKYRDLLYLRAEPMANHPPVLWVPLYLNNDCWNYRDSVACEDTISPNTCWHNRERYRNSWVSFQQFTLTTDHHYNHQRLAATAIVSSLAAEWQRNYHLNNGDWWVVARLDDEVVTELCTHSKNKMVAWSTPMTPLSIRLLVLLY